MRRREFIGVVATAALSFPRPGYAQTKTGLPVVGVLSATLLALADEMIEQGHP
jgi:hypothetical protein